MKYIALLIFLTTCSTQFAACGRDEEESKPVIINVATLNVQHMAAENAQQRIAEFILSENLDVVLLQELDNGADRSGNVDQLAQLSHDTGYAYYNFVRTIDLDGGEYGIGILSKWPIDYASSYLLPVSDELRSIVYYEDRKVQHVKISVQGQVFDFFNTHLHWENATRDEQWSALKVFLGQRKNAVIGGDFNAYMSDLQPFSLAYDEPELSVDHVFAQGFNRLSSKRIGEGLSDHLAYVVQLELVR